MANTIGPPPTGTGWDEDAPVANTDPHGNACYEIRDLRKGLRIRVSKEHTSLAANSAGGEHKQGSAVAWIQAQEPTTRPDGQTALTSSDLGRIWVDTANKAIKVLTAVGTPNTWTVAGELLLGLYEAGHEPASGLYLKGNELYFKGGEGVEKLLAGLIDEDDMASDSATRAPSEQSVKAFVAAYATANAVLQTGDQTIAGVKTFSSAPQSSADATGSSGLVRRNQVDASTIEFNASHQLQAKDGGITWAKLATGGAQFKTGTYTGNGNSNRAVTGVGFQPSIVILFDHTNSSSYGWGIKTAQMGTSFSHFSANGYQQNLIVSLDADGFTLGTNASYVNNADGRTYSWIAIGIK